MKSKPKVFQIFVNFSCLTKKDQAQAQEDESVADNSSNRTAGWEIYRPLAF